MDNHDGDDAREALRAAMLDWRESLMAAVFLPDKLSVEPWYFDAWERAPYDSEQVFRLSCFGAADAPDFPGRMEAAELFAVLARVDFALWRELVSEIWPADAAWADFFETRTALRVGLEVCGGVDDLRQLCAFLTEQNELTTSPRYKRTREHVARASNIDLALSFVPIRIALFAARDERVSWLLWELGDVLVNLDNQHGLRITQLKLETPDHDLNETAMDCVEWVRAAGIQVTNLPLVDVVSWVSSDANCFKSLASVLHVDAPVGTRPVSTDGVERIVLNRIIPDDELARALSSAHSSRSLCAIELDLDDFVGEEQVDARSRVVWWVAFALFRRATPLTTLEIHAHSLFAKDIEWMEQMMAAPNPMSLLFPEETNTAAPRVAQTSQALLWDPHDEGGAERQESWTWRSPKNLDVLSDSHDGFITVMLPAWGKAWVRESTARILPRAHPYEWNKTTPSHLILRSMRNATMDAVLRLLRLVGRGVRRLEIDASACEDVTLDAFCAQALSACPHLEELELFRVELTNFQFLHDAIHIQKCPALQKLTLWGIHLGEETAVDDLLLWLESPCNRMALQLRKLGLAPCGLVRSATLESTRQMISANTRLREVTLRFLVDPDLRAHHETQFEPLRRSQASEPLSPRCICAFLSVASTSSDWSGARASSALRRLDCWIFRLVLDFAATPRIQFVTFQAVSPRAAPVS